VGYVALSLFKYLTVSILSGHSHKITGRVPPAIPWKEICDRPDRYYNDATFTLPVKIKDPKEYLDDPVDLFPLLKFFSNTAANESPFQFELQTNGGSGAAKTMPGSNPSRASSPLIDLGEPLAMTSGSDDVQPSRNSAVCSSPSPMPVVPVAGKKMQNEIALDPRPVSTPSEPVTTSPVPSSSIPPSNCKSASGRKGGKRKKGSKLNDMVSNSALTTPSAVPISTVETISSIVASSTTAATKAGKKKGKARKLVKKVFEALAMPTPSTITSPTKEIPPADGPGGRQRKASRRARGIGYDECTPSPAKKRKIA
jgi:hypothetical protein